MRPDGVKQDVLIGDTYYHGETYFRLRHESTTHLVHFETSFDGATWTQVHSIVFTESFENTRI